jgi:hypothetical protein
MPGLKGAVSMRDLVRLALLLGPLAATTGCLADAPPPTLTPRVAACGDPCGAMVCPAGSECIWNDRCQPRCAPQPMTPTLRP